MAAATRPGSSERVFLALTALRPFWRSDRPRVYLGDWCLPPSRPRRGDERVLPPLWRGARLDEARAAVDRCLARLQPALGERLNELLGVRLSPRYWQLATGRWLRDLVTDRYDKYAHLRAAFDAYPELTTRLLTRLSPAVERALPAADRLHYRQLAVYSDTLRRLGYDFPARQMPLLSSGLPARLGEWLRARRERATRPKVSGYRRSAAATGGSEAGRVVVGQLHIQEEALEHLRRHTEPGGVVWDPLDDRWLGTLGGDADAGLRERLELTERLHGAGEFERLVAGLVPELLPAVFLERHPAARAALRRRFPRRPLAVVTTVASTTFDLLAAETAEGGGRVVRCQHGIDFGTARRSPAEDEIPLSDRYVTWGWGEEDPAAYRDLPCIKNSALELERRPAAGGWEVLFAASRPHPYPVRLTSTLLGGGWSDYCGWQERFLEALVPGTVERLLYRFKSVDELGWLDALRRRFPRLALDDSHAYRGATLAERLAEATIAVVDCPSQTHSECLASGVPTLLFWDPDRFEAHPRAEPLFAELAEAGILWHSPEAAAAELERALPDPEGWWAEPARRAAVESYHRRFARTTAGWLEPWSRFLVCLGNQATAPEGR